MGKCRKGMFCMKACSAKLRDAALFPQINFLQNQDINHAESFKLQTQFMVAKVQLAIDFSGENFPLMNVSSGTFQYK